MRLHYENRYFADLAASVGDDAGKAVRRAVDRVQAKLGGPLVLPRGEQPSQSQQQQQQQQPAVLGLLANKLDFSALARSFSLPLRAGVLVVPTAVPEQEVSRALADTARRLGKGLDALNALPMASVLLNGTRQLECVVVVVVVVVVVGVGVLIRAFFFLGGGGC